MYELTCVYNTFINKFFNKNEKVKDIYYCMFYHMHDIYSYVKWNGWYQTEIRPKKRFFFSLTFQILILVYLFLF